MNNHWKYIRNYKDGNTNPALDDYEYDANGNLIKDRNKGITSITYNYLNLPERIEWSANKFITYQYNAAGQKLTKTVRDNDSIKIVRYLDGFQYAGSQLQFFPTSEGYVKATPVGNANPDLPPTGYAYNYTFNYTDHLGNIRLSYTKDPQSGTLQILEENHYYPFGLRHEVYVSGTKLDFSRNPGDGIEPEPGLPPVLDYVTRMEYQYKYNGKEFQDELGLGLYDYGARNYDPAIGRWMSVDPLAEKYPGISPYAYVANNPINAIDPDGRLIIFINGQHTGDGGSRKYWNGLDNRIMNQVGDRHARYYDGAMGGWANTGLAPVTGNNLIPGNRRRAGKRIAYKQAAEIFGSLGDGETIKIATHSMGGAYGKGFIQGLKKYAKKNNIDISGLIEFEVDLAPFQPTMQEAQEGVPTTVIAHEGDIVAGSDEMPGAQNNTTRKGKKKSLSEHSVDSFTQDEINRLVPESEKNRPGESVWEQKPKSE